VKAQARIVGSDTVEVWADGIADPVAVRYGWANFPLCNLYNSAGLPACPFRSDSFLAPDFEVAQLEKLKSKGEKMKKSILAGVLLSGSLAGQAAMVMDDFNRDDSKQSRDSALVGAEWKQESSVNEWLIKGSILHGRNREVQAILFNDRTQTTGGGFAVSVDVSAKESSVWAGLVFNYHDKDNFNVLRFKGDFSAYQLLACTACSVYQHLPQIHIPKLAEIQATKPHPGDSTRCPHKHKQQQRLYQPDGSGNTMHSIKSKHTSKHHHIEQ